MIIFYSGYGGRNNPEKILRHRANMMLTFFEMQKKPSRRFRRLLSKRKREGKRR